MNKKSVMIQKIKFCKKFDIFGWQFSETCLRMHTFNKIRLSNLSNIQRLLTLPSFTNRYFNKPKNLKNLPQKIIYKDYSKFDSKCYVNDIEKNIPSNENSLDKLNVNICN